MSLWGKRKRRRLGAAALVVAKRKRDFNEGHDMGFDKGYRKGWYDATEARVAREKETVLDEYNGNSIKEYWGGHNGA